MSGSEDDRDTPPAETITDDENVALLNEEGHRRISCTSNNLHIEQKENRKIIEVKCGPLYAKMHVELFLCPGIHQHCIELNGEMISPKEFTVRANKDKQKDWKGSIRIGKSNLRTLMEMRSFDFYNHTQFCSAKCQSRNYITPKEKDPDRDSRRGSTCSQKSAPPISQLFGNQLLGSAPTLGMLHNLKEFKPTAFSQLFQLSTVLNNGVCPVPSLPLPPNPTTTIPNMESVQAMQASEELVDVDDTLNTTTESSPHRTTPSASTSPTQPPPAAQSTQTQAGPQPTADQFIHLMNTEPMAFWSEIHQLGILDTITDQMMQSVVNAKETARIGGVNHVASTFSKLTSILGLNDFLVACIRARPNIPPGLLKPRLSTDYSCVEDNTGRKRSVDESSQSSQSPPLVVKRPRVQYPVAMMTGNDLTKQNLEHKVLSALLQAQMQQQLAAACANQTTQNLAPQMVPQLDLLMQLAQINASVASGQPPITPIHPTHPNLVQPPSLTSSISNTPRLSDTLLTIKHEIVP
ncbi:hypothetical protein WR25_12554 [Diploscapter pachys]|uniref:SAND domain-containing protein n=1 Tax=Diploscapter pachys TaxID=2018661 RepID=A0A2A2JRC4_9BILA|nr:hypothetical protein WR25_12554 [Diploscapter pachys]